jgi:predicted  nucleic acid-binding Zn-ribbon protein
MTETTNPTNTVETLEEQLETLEKGLREATSSAQRASRRLQDIEARKDKLSPGVFSGDTDATERYKALEEDEREASRSLRVAQVAGEQLKEAIAETKKALSEARKNIHRERYRELSEEHDKVCLRRDGLAAELYEVLEEESRLHSEMTQVLSRYDTDAANAIASIPNPTRYWLRDFFARWLR